MEQRQPDWMNAAAASQTGPDSSQERTLHTRTSAHPAPSQPPHEQQSQQQQAPAGMTSVTTSQAPAGRTSVATSQAPDLTSAMTQREPGVPLSSATMGHEPVREGQSTRSSLPQPMQQAMQQLAQQRTVMFQAVQERAPLQYQVLSFAQRSCPGRGCGESTACVLVMANGTAGQLSRVIAGGRAP